MKSPLEIHLEQELFNMLDGAALDIARILCNDEEIHTYQELANTVSIKRLGFNDHGPVHMRKVAINAMRMFNLLMEAGIRPSLVNEDIGTETDSRIAVLLAAFLHDIGMSIGRQSHEMSSFILANPLMERVLKCIFPDEAARWIAIKTVALEGIMGHMTHHAIHTLEAGIILIDGQGAGFAKSKTAFFADARPVHNTLRRMAVESATASGPATVRDHFATG
jgi:metal-dependent HD superfamily phosphatase/phosphodiesterase